MYNNTILVIDDTPQNLALLTDLLRETKHTVLVAEDGESGIDRAHYALPDLILIDIMMPGIDGIETCKRLKKSEITKSIPVIFITALNDLECKIRCFQAGGVDFITKPFQREEVLARVGVQLQTQKLIHELNKTNTLMTSIYTSIQDGIIAFDENNNIINNNSAALALCCSEDIQKNCDSVCSKACLEIVEESRRTNTSRKKQRLECNCDKKSKHVISLTASPLIDLQGQNIGTVLVLKDDTYVSELETLVQNKCHFNEIIGENKTMRAIYSSINDLAPTNTTVLITGESGTGKDLIAHAVHSNSPRKDKPFVVVNCGAIPEQLIESELFGHKKGSFTGAISDRVGLFEQADGGTLFLDEIGELPLLMQVKLLRAIQERAIRRVGDSVEKKVDVRVIAATNKNLLDRIQAGQFREDLYYRLNVFTISLPPLRERLDDVPLLISYLLNKTGLEQGKDNLSMSDNALKSLIEYPWPGNIRELHNTIEYAVVRCRGPVILTEHLPATFHTTPASKPVETLSIEDALAATDGNKAKAARLLGIDRRTLYRKLGQD